MNNLPAIKALSIRPVLQERDRITPLRAIANPQFSENVM